MRLIWGVLLVGVSRGGRIGPPVPPRGIIRRSRLFARLGARQTVVVSGTAGYGKSVLIASWLTEAAPPGAVAWLTIDPSDDDPARLTADVLASLRASDLEPLTEALRRLEAPPLFADPLGVIDSVHEALYDSGVLLTLVLDDVHHLARSARACAVLDHFLQWAPSSTRVILSGRTIPPLRLQRMRLEDRLEVIGHHDLAFTLEETSEAVFASGLDVDVAAVGALHGVTQGWPAGVRLAVLAMRARASHDPPRELRRDDALADYLTTEVLASLDDEVRSFVLEATVDEVVCPGLVDTVRGTRDAGVLLERCVAEGLFLTREDGADDGDWYRWHSLFAAHMRGRRWALGQGRAESIERAAARWWEGVDPASAVPHALAAGDAEDACRILASSWLELVLAGRLDTVRSLVASIPSGVREAAELHLALAHVAAQAGDVRTARVELGEARECPAALGEAGRVRFEVRATVIELFIVNDRAALAEAVATGRRLLLRAADGPWTPDVATLALVRLCVGMGEARLLEDVPAASVLLRLAAATARSAGFVALELQALAESCIPAIAEGDLEETRHVAEGVLAAARAKGWGELPSLAPAHGFLGWLALWRGDAWRAREHLDRALGMMLPTDWGLRGLVITVHAEACLVLGDVAAAEADSREDHDLARSGHMPPWWPSLRTAIDANILLARGEAAAALHLVSAPAPGPDYYLATCYRANVFLQGGRPGDCLAVLDSYPPERMYPHVAVMVEALRAQALAETGEEGPAQAALERALGHAARHGLLEPFLVIGPTLGPLLRDHLRTGTAHPEVVIGVQDRLAASGTSAVNEWGESLTVREQTILRYLATNLSNAEIAEAEFITLNTAKTHLAHIYRKLGVSNRRGAVRAAADLGLI